MYFHFQRYECQDAITSRFSGYNLHNLCPSFKLLLPDRTGKARP